jgi:hypothetical protein
MKPGKKPRWSSIGQRTELRIHLDGGFEIFGEYVLLRGRVLKFAVVLLWRDEQENVLQVRRYDTAHGFAHLDILSRKGNLLRKVRLTEPANYQEALEYALADFKENYQAYGRGFSAT